MEQWTLIAVWAFSIGFLALIYRAALNDLVKASDELTRLQCEAEILKSRMRDWRHQARYEGEDDE